MPRRRGPVNLADALVAPDVLRPFIENWEEVAVHFLRSVQADAVADGTEETAALLRAPDSPIRACRRSRASRRSTTHTPVLSIHFRKGDTALRVFTTIATLGTPQDVTLQEIRIECFFPSDPASADVVARVGGCVKLLSPA